MAKKILLADDSITIQKVIELTFSDEDFDVVTVGNGRLALERLPEVRPDIVLCDIIMPEKDGYEVCEQVKSNPAWAQIPVLLLTGAFEPFDQERAARAGYDGSLAKPFEPETLIAKVKDLLAKAPRAAAAPVVVQKAPAPPPPAAAPARAGGPGTTPVAASFIPDEPFSGLDASAFVSSAAAATDTGAIATNPPGLAAISAEEAASLSGPAATNDDTSSTVMFPSSPMSWASPAPAPAPAAGGAVGTPPRPAEAVRLVSEEPAAFEAVLEEDLDFGPGDYVAEAREVSGAGETGGFEESTLPPVAPIEEGASGPFAALVKGEMPLVESAGPTTGAYARVEGVPEPAELAPDTAEVGRQVRVPPPPPPPPPARTLLDPSPTPQPPPLPRYTEPVPPPKPKPAPQPTFEAGPARTLLDPPRREEPPPPPLRMPPPAAPPVPISAPAPELIRAVPPSTQPPIPPAAPEPAPQPPASAAPRETSFAEIAAAAVEEGAAPRHSEAAAVAVPVDMVDKIAQRVVAQISEKIVREIAWEVIPDLAETLIKREIERLKAELAKL